MAHISFPWRAGPKCWRLNKSTQHPGKYIYIYIYEDDVLLKLYRKLRKMFLSPKLESNPQPSDLRWDGFDSSLGLRNIFLSLRKRLSSK